jgi:hypothetical protein
MLADLPKEKVKLTELEGMIIEKRLSGPSFCQLRPDLLRVEVDSIILAGAAITGCNLPTTDFFAEAITREIIAFISESGYENLTMEEILFALRVNERDDIRWPSGDYVTQVPFVGNTFNVSFLAKVLANYMRFRKILDRKLENFIDGYDQL